MPAELTLLGKTLLQLDEIGKLLDPEFDPDAAIRSRLWGYPGLAMMCFLAAAAGGLWLVLSIVVQDRKKRT